MWQVHPFHRHFCVIFLSLALFTTYVSLKARTAKYNKSKPTSDLLNSTSDVPRLNTSIDISGNKEFATTVQDNIRFNYTFDPNLWKGWHNENQTYELHILGLFELSTKSGKRLAGLSEMLAAKLAVEYVNELKVLPGYKLNLLINDTECDPGIGMDRFFHALYSNKTVLMLLGSGCSNVTERLAHVVPYWNILQVSYGSKSPSLSDRSKFPLFFRTVAPDSSHNNAKIHFVKEFGWKVVATFSQSENEYLLPLNYLIKDLERINISCMPTITFSAENYREQLRVLKDLDVRIIIASFSTRMASKIFCVVYQLKMYGEDYVWILQYDGEPWWDFRYDCHIKDTLTAVEGLILFSDSRIELQHELSISKLSSPLFYKKLNISENNISKYAMEAYDAVWAMALALRLVQLTYWFDALENFHYKRNDMVYRFMVKMAELQFIGLSGPVKFSGADRVGNSIIQQIQRGEITNIAIFDSVRSALNFKCRGCKKLFWKSGKIPIAQRKLKFKFIIIPETLFYSTVIICLTGITVSLLFLYFNLHFGTMRSVKLSSPKLNNIAVIGCIFVYVYVILLGLHNINFEPDTYFNELCVLRVYFLSAGFSLAFGSMFAKAYRVHRIFTYFGINIAKNKLLKDKQLTGLILIPLLVDAIILSLWVMVDPLERHLHNLTLEINRMNRGVVFQPQIEICKSHNTVGWYVALYGYKGLILIMGLFMAWETRHVKVPALNDSQYIGICVYSAVFSSIVVIFSSLATEYVVFSYLAKVISILTSTTVTLFLLFLPKLKHVFGQVEKEDPITQSMGLKIESNTRRFISNDPKEQMFRLEIQNRVYKCELQALDKEIARLEDLLLYSSSPSTKSCHNTFETSADCYYLDVPSPHFVRASWPNACGQLLKQNSKCLSENKLSQEQGAGKPSIFGKLKRLFGSIPAVSVHTYLNQSAKYDLDLYHVKYLKQKPKSNPEVSTVSLPKKNLIKAMSECHIDKTNES